MRVVLIYDEPLPSSERDGLPEDLGAEYEEASAIEGLRASIAANGHEAEGLVFGEDLAARLRAAAPDLVVNIAEGVRGATRESIVPAWCDHLGFPYTGSDGLTLAVTLDKALTKTIVAALGAATPAFRRVSSMEQLDGIDLAFPLFVKPNAEGSSMGIRYASKVTTPEALYRQVEWVLETYAEDCLVEEFAPGSEYCVGILGNDPPDVLPIVEVLSPGDFYSYEDKHRHDKELLCPAPISAALDGELRRTGLEIYRALRCRDLARMEFKIDKTGRPTFLEINPLPGLAADYGVFAHQARAAGLDHAALIGRLIDCARARTAKQTAPAAEEKASS